MMTTETLTCLVADEDVPKVVERLIQVEGLLRIEILPDPSPDGEHGPNKSRKLKTSPAKG